MLLDLNRLLWFSMLVAKDIKDGCLVVLSIVSCCSVGWPWCFYGSCFSSLAVKEPWGEPVK